MREFEERHVVSLLPRGDGAFNPTFFADFLNRVPKRFMSPSVRTECWPHVFKPRYLEAYQAVDSFNAPQVRGLL